MCIRCAFRSTTLHDTRVENIERCAWDVIRSDGVGLYGSTTSRCLTPGQAATSRAPLPMSINAIVKQAGHGVQFPAKN